MSALLDEVRDKLLNGSIFGGEQVVDGRFWPYNAAPTRIRTSDTIKKHLKAAGYAAPSPERDGYWVLTEAGQEWLAAGRLKKGEKP